MNSTHICIQPNSISKGQSAMDMKLKPCVAVTNVGAQLHLNFSLRNIKILLMQLGVLTLIPCSSTLPKLCMVGGGVVGEVPFCAFVIALCLSPNQSKLIWKKTAKGFRLKEELNRMVEFNLLKGTHNKELALPIIAGAQLYNIKLELASFH